MTFSKLGRDSDTHQIVELSQASRRQGLYIIGATTGLTVSLVGSQVHARIVVA